MPPKKSTITTEGTRRSARVASASANTATKEAAPEHAAVGKKRREDAGSTDENESNDDEGTEEPKAKKLKVTSKARATAKKKEDPPSGRLQIGDVIPDMTLKNEKEEDVDVKQLAQNGLVIFVVPKADTPGCTNQACAFRDAYADFSKEGYAVFCLSNDKSGAQAKWQTKKALPYSLLSDPTRTFISAIGAGSANKTIRSHFIFEKGTGKLIDMKVPVSAKQSSQLALEFVQSLKGEASDG